MTTDEYIDLITQEHRDKPRYVETVRASVDVLADLQAKLRKFIRDFDVDEAVGKQLDTIGQWVGIGRVVQVPISNFYFTWDYNDATGWDAGVWEAYGDDRFDQYDLPDDLYRRIIYAKILLNSWKGRKGTIEEAYKIFNIALSVPHSVRIIDGEYRQVSPSIIFSWDEAGKGWDEAVWETPVYPYFAWDTLGHGWDEAIWSSFDYYGDEVMQMWVLLREGALPSIEELLVFSGFIPFRLAGVKTNYGMFN